ncbi:hypothetical protein ACFE04_028780 [Oxalis oulophora]
MDLAWLSALIVGAAGCLAIGLYVGAKHPAALFLSTKLGSDTAKTANKNKIKKSNKAKEPLEIEKYADILEDFKMVLVVRNELKMGKGKIAAQCSHATLGLYKKLVSRAPKALDRWEMCAQPKVVVKIETEEDMLVLQERAKTLKLPTHITVDAGKTQIAPNSRTVMAILGNSFISAFVMSFFVLMPNKHASADLNDYVIDLMDQLKTFLLNDDGVAILGYLGCTHHGHYSLLLEGTLSIQLLGKVSGLCLVRMLVISTTIDDYENFYSGTDKIFKLIMLI